MIEFRLATQQDVLRVALGLREVDKQEAIATAGEDYTGSLLRTWRSSSLCWIAEEDGKAIAIFGVVPGFQARQGFPWLMGTDLLDTRSKELLKHSRWYVELMNSMYPILMNYADCRNTSTQRWLKWCGFTFGGVIPDFGQARIPFIHFYRYRNVP
jgi:hypothetical protein